MSKNSALWCKNEIALFYKLMVNSCITSQSLCEIWEQYPYGPSGQKDLTLYCLNKIKEIMILLLQNSRKPVRQTILLIGIIWWVQFQSSNKVSNNTWIYVYIKKTWQNFNSNSNSNSREFQLQFQLQLRKFQLQLQLQLRPISRISTPTPTPGVSTPTPTPASLLNINSNSNSNSGGFNSNSNSGVGVGVEPNSNSGVDPNLIHNIYIYTYILSCFLWAEPEILCTTVH